LSAIVFLWAYVVLHVGHAFGIDLGVATAVSSIPLFSIFVTSAVVAAGASLLASAAGGAPRPRSASGALAISIAAFGLAMILVP
jgi:hypothetical protein